MKLPYGGLAQLVERVVRNDEARGSNPLLSTFHSAADFVVEGKLRYEREVPSPPAPLIVT